MVAAQAASCTAIIIVVAWTRCWRFCWQKRVPRLPRLQSHKSLHPLCIWPLSLPFILPWARPQLLLRCSLISQPLRCSLVLPAPMSLLWAVQEAVPRSPMARQIVPPVLSPRSTTSLIILRKLPLALLQMSQAQSDTFMTTRITT